jgi:hypothetical protein
MKFTASRLSEGNKVFPAQIHIEQTGVTVKIPGLFRGDTKFFDYNLIASVDVKAPLVGYSTVTFYAGGTQISAHGFTSSEVKQIKQAIEKGKSQSVGSSGVNENFSVNKSEGSSKGSNMWDALKQTRDDSQNNPYIIGTKAYNERIEKEKENKKEEKQRLEGKVNEIASIVFGATTEDISNQLSQLVTIGNAKPDKNVKSAIVEKMEFGIMKLKGLGANVEAAYFEQKVEPLKKKSWF